MKITDLLDVNSIDLSFNPGSKKAAIESLVDLMDKGGKLSDKAQYLEDVLAREAQSTTGVGEQVAIPHAKSAGVKAPGLAAAVCADGLDFESLDAQPAKLFFMIAAPDGAGTEHLKVLSKLSGFLMDSEFKDALLNAESPDAFLAVIDAKEGVDEEVAPATAENPAAEGRSKKILAVTACPTGIAHTFMAAEALNQKAKEAGVEIKVETNGSAGIKNPLTAADIEEAVGIIVAADKKIEMARFNGKKVIQVKVADGIHKAAELIERAANGDAPVYQADEAVDAAERDEVETIGRKVYKHLMSGVSNMLPFVVGGGVLIALAFLFDDYAIDPANFGSNTQVAEFFMGIGGMAFGFMLPVLAGFIAYSIADRPGLAVGFVGGMLANAGESGFLGAMLAGFAAGFIVLGLKKVLNVLPDSLEGVKPVLLYPLFGILIIGAAMQFILNPPVYWLNAGLVNWLEGMQAGGGIIVGIVLGSMMAIDMGGPINKAAYVTGIAALDAGNYYVMAAVMAGGMVPPLAIAISTMLFKNKFTQSEQKSGKVNVVMGLSFITEGAIPFAAADPLRVIPSCMIGSAIAGALSMVFGATLRAPHGGMFVLPTIGNWALYLLAVVIGSVVGAVVLGVWKKQV